MGKITVRRRIGKHSSTVVEQEDVRGYRVVVHLMATGDGPARRVAEIAIASPEGDVSPRDVRRLPLSTIIEVARDAAAIAHHEQRSTLELSRARSRLTDAARQVDMPRGRPMRGRSAKWYLDLLETYRELQAQGVRPVAAIAKRKGADPNTVHQWIHRARKIEELQRREDR